MCLPLTQDSVIWCCLEHTDCVTLRWECAGFFCFVDSCFARFDASVPTADPLLILEVRVILTWSSFNWQIERISLTTSLGSHSTLLHLTQWVEHTCHLCGQSPSTILNTLVQTVSFFLSLSSSFSCAFLSMLRSYSQDCKNQPSY